MSRLALFVALLAPLGCGSRGGPAIAPGTPIVLLTLDTTRADRIGAYGRADAETPALDALAQSGVVFENAFTPVPTTLSSHASILTGTYPPFHGVRFNLRFRLSARPPMVPEILRARGYRTVAAVAAAVLDRKFGVARGFDLYDDELGGAAPDETGIPERPANLVTDAAIAALDSVPKGLPYFLWAHYYDPHVPYEPPAEFRAAAGGDAYQGEIAFMDSEIDRLLRAVRARGGPAPIVVAVADHGESLREHGENTHGLFVYDTTMRVPLIVSGGVPSGVRVPDLVRTIDVAPTILELLSIEIPPAMQGKSLCSLANGGKDAFGPRDAYLETFMPRFTYGWSELVGIRTAGSKFVHAPQPELFDLDADPGETRNILLEDRTAGVSMERRLERRKIEIESAEASDSEAANDPETERRLAALGYVAGVAAGDDGGPRPDPKSMAHVHRDMERLDGHLRAGEIEEGRRLADRLIAREPRNLHVFRTIGNALYDREDLDGALDYLSRGAALEPLDIDLHQKIGHTHLARAAVLSDPEAARAAMERALAEFELATRLNPDAADAWNNVGLSLFLLGRLDDAVKALRTALERRPTLATARFNLARALDSRGDRADAEREYREVVRLSPDDADANERLAILASARGAAGEAAAAYDRVRRAAPGRVVAAVPVAVALQQAGRLKEALSILEDAREKGGRDATLLRLLGAVRGASGEREGAAAALIEAAAASPDDAELAGELARALYAAGRLVEAAEAFGTEARLSPDDAIPLYHRGVALEAAGREADARDAYEAARGREPGNARVLNALAWLLVTAKDASVRDAAAALPLARRAVTAEPESASYRDTLAEALFANGDEDGARAELRRAVDAAPEREKDAYRKRLAELDARERDG